MDSSKYANNEYAVELEHVSKIYKLKKKDGEPNNNVVSTMIWGSMWDRALIWLTETGEKTYKEITNSTT